jgi:hypothetical protein
VNQERDAEHFEDPHPGISRISLVMTRPSWMREAASNAEQAVDERQLWDAPPGYSLTTLPSPAPVTQVTPRQHTWRTLLLVAAISLAEVALLAVEWNSLS